MRSSTHSVTWVVYRLMMYGKNKGGMGAVCEQTEWDAMEKAQPGHHTLRICFGFRHSFSDFGPTPLPPVEGRPDILKDRRTMSKPAPTTPPLSRGDIRPVRRRTRTFRPNYLSFAGTYQCNLDCPHCCVPIEWTDRLDIAVALKFLEDAHRFGIRTLGFTGSEP